MPYVFQTVSKKTGKPHPRWRFQYQDWQGRRRTATGNTSKAETKRLALGVQAEHHAVRKGYRPAPRSYEAARRRPFADVTAEYLAWGRAQGGRGGRPWGKGHERKRRARLALWADRLGLQALADLDGILPRVEAVIRELLAAGRTPKTARNLVESLKAFCSWCVTRGYLAEDPLKSMAPINGTPKTRRRALTQDEVNRLLKAVSPERHLLYAVALCSGLRVGELRALRVEHLDRQRGGLAPRGGLDEGATARVSTAPPIPPETPRGSGRRQDP